MKREKLEILFEDVHFIVVNKPPRFLTIPDRFAHRLANLYHLLQDRYGEIFIVHRLDRETSGIICFARTKEIHKDLCQQFEARTVKKTYLTLVQGCPLEEEGRIDKAIGKSLRTPGKMVVTKKGKPSITDYKVIEKFKYHTLVEADIKTGRTHQIRVHFSSIGNPLTVDPIYSGKDSFYLSELKKKYKQGKNKEESPLMSRTTLHAYCLRLEHPITKEVLEFTAPLPKDFKAVVQQLRKWGK